MTFAVVRRDTSGMNPKQRHVPAADVPLVVDFDGTLHRSDLTWEAIAWAMRHDWRLLWLAVFAYLRHGRAAAKLVLEDHLLGHWHPDLPLDERTADLLREAQARGRRVVVATGSPQRLVMQVLAAHGMDVEVWGTVENTTNLTARHKAAALVKTFGEKGFDYAGNSYADHPVWAVARKAWIVNAGTGVTRRAMGLGNHEHVLPKVLRARWAVWQALRPHLWLKNLLVLLPVIAAQAWQNVPVLIAAGWAFLALSLVSSAMYLLNDVLDISEDRAHLHKKQRAVAAGLFPIGTALLLVPLLLAGAWAAAVQGGQPLLHVIQVYAALSLGYALVFKYWPQVDVLLLAGLYTLRIVAGMAATGLGLSVWLLLACFLLFESLMLMKRFVEVRMLDAEPAAQTGLRRPYHPADLPLLLVQGLAVGFAGVSVLAMHAHSAELATRYTHADWFALLCLLVLAWLGRLWHAANRGTMADDDPVMHALQDPLSWLLLVGGVGCLLAAV
ncbi:MAG: UbiA family prenyltransferase [Pseudomonadaceae bacterium]|nr:UbiA family prenyltransferase [Pseudomonadaceae bacterium]